VVDLIKTPGAHHWPINAGFAERFHDLSVVDVTDDDGRVGRSIFEARPRPFPVGLTLMGTPSARQSGLCAAGPRALL
jgi:ureidoglycolate lyase